MILKYYRPQTLDEALALLARQDLTTVPLGGGTALNRPSNQRVAAVDLQALDLDRIEVRGSQMMVGATARLQALLDHPQTPAALARAVALEATYNLRQVATAAGALVAADGRSPYAAALLAMDVQLELLPGAETISAGDILPLRQERLRGRLIRNLILPLNASLAFQTVARTPADRPVVCVAVARWPSGRTRIVVGGWGTLPRLALDGEGQQDVSAAVAQITAQAEDPWASAEYRQQVAVVLARRGLQELGNE